MSSLDKFLTPTTLYQQREYVRTVVDPAYASTMQDRYNQVQGKSESELASMGIQILDGSYFKDGVAWLSREWINQLSGRTDLLYDSNGNYLYPLDIPMTIMGEVIKRYGTTLSKDELIKIARDTYQNTGSNVSDATVGKAVDNVKSNIQQTNPDLAYKLDASDSTAIPTSSLTNSPAPVSTSKSFLKKYGWWIAGGVTFIGLVYFLVPKRKTA